MSTRHRGSKTPLLKLL